MYLIIAEKPSVARDLASALGGFEQVKVGSGNFAPSYFKSASGYIAAARGHLVEIGVAQDQDPGWDLAKLPILPEPFQLTASEDTKASLKVIADLAKQSTVIEVINACDAGREGEAIFRLIITYLSVSKPTSRMWFTTMTVQGLKEAFVKRQPGEKYKGLAAAAKARNEADWLVGVNATRALTCAAILPGDVRLTAGRVQTPTLSLIVDRELTIKHFVPKAFHEIVGSFAVGAAQWEAKWFNPNFVADPSNPDATNTRLLDSAKAGAIAKAVAATTSPANTLDTTSEEKRAAPDLFDLTSLQRLANVALGFSASKTLELAQALYEKHKVTTYPRTDSRFLPEDYGPKVLQTLQALNAPFSKPAQKIIDNAWVTPEHRVFNNSKISDHFAIIPTGKAPEGLDEQERLLYDMIVKRFMAAFYPAAVFAKTVRVSTVETAQGMQHFKTIGKVPISLGWLEIEAAANTAKNKDDEDATTLPPLPTSPAPANVLDAKVKSGKTSPPPRYTEASLLGAMETAGKLVDDDELAEAMSERGLGTPATRAATIEKLLEIPKNQRNKNDTAYLARSKKTLVPTEKGIALVQALRKSDCEFLTTPALTGKWEQALDVMQTNQGATAASFDLQIRAQVEKMVKAIQANSNAKPRAPTASKTPATATTLRCPCGKENLTEKGLLYNGPLCKFTLWKNMSGRNFSESEIEQLLTNGATDNVLQGFTSRTKGTKFGARVKLEGGKVVFDFEATR